MNNILYLLLSASILFGGSGCMEETLKPASGNLLDSIRVDVYDASDVLSMQFLHTGQDMEAFYSDLGFYESGDSMVYQEKLETCTPGDSFVTLFYVFRNDRPEYFEYTPWMGCSGPMQNYSMDQAYLASGNLATSTYNAREDMAYTHTAVFQFNYSGNDILSSAVSGEFDDNRPGTFPFTYSDLFAYPNAYPNPSAALGFDLNDIIVANYFRLAAFSEYGSLTPPLSPTPASYMGDSDFIVSADSSYINKLGNLIEHIQINRDRVLDIYITYEFDAAHDNRVSKMTMYCDGIDNPRSVFTFYYKN